MRVLFVCTANIARSPMAAAMFHDLAGRQAGHVARSAGTQARVAGRLTTRDLAWADVVAVMEVGHFDLIRRQWPDHAGKVRVLGVPDEYDPDEPQLRKVLTGKLLALVRQLNGGREDDAVAGDPPRAGEAGVAPLGRVT